jgi:hypothetical protein
MIVVANAFRSELGSHAWLEIDALVVDITEDQFPGRMITILERPDDWHLAWGGEREQLGNSPLQTDEPAAKRYAAVAAHAWGYLPKPRASKPRIKAPSESLFTYIDRLDHPLLERGRALTNHWLSQVPDAMLYEFVRRLGSRRDSDHFSALHELYLFDLCRRAGLRPSLESHGRSKPDLRLQLPDGSDWAIEATVTMPPPEELAAENRLSSLWWHVSPMVLDRRVRVFIRGEVQQTVAQPSARRLAAWLNAWAAEDGEGPEPSGAMSARTEAREYEDETSGWSMMLSLLSVDNDDCESIVAGGPTIAYHSEFDPLLRVELEGKRRQHRGQSIGMTTCLSWNYFKHGPSVPEIMSSLYRSEITAILEGRPLPPKSAELLWCSPCYPWSVAELRTTLWLRKDATPSAFAAAWPGDRMIVDAANQSVELVPGSLAPLPTS